MKKISPLRVVHVLADLYRGGTETQVLNLCRGVRGRDPSFEFGVLTLFDRGPFAAEFEESGIPVRSLQMSRGHPLRLASGCIRFLREYRPDIVHTHHCFADRWGQAAALACGVQARVSTFHNARPPAGFQEWLTARFTALLARRIVCVSQSVADEWVQRRRVPGRKVEVIYNAPGFEPRPGMAARQGIPGRTVRLICVGSYRPVKGHACAVRAVSMLVSRGMDVCLEIYGADPAGYREETGKTVLQEGVPGCVELHGPTAGLDEVLEHADILLAPSLDEGFGMAVVESMAAGVPVVASDIPAHREVLDGGAYGILAPVRDARAFADAVVSLMENPGRYRDLSAAGIVRAKRFSRDSMVDGYHALYRSLAGR